MNRQTIKDVLLGKGKYSIGFLDDSLNIPILLGLDDVRFLRKNFKQNNLDTRANALFDWIHSNVSYGDSKRNIFDAGYRSAKETLVGKQGVCGEMAYLYVASARAVGLRSNYVSVEKDFNNKRVHHACAAVYTPNLKLADIAYHQFGINHTSIKVLSDLEMLQRFNSWR